MCDFLRTSYEACQICRFGCLAKSFPTSDSMMVVTWTLNFNLRFTPNDSSNWSQKLKTNYRLRCSKRKRAKSTLKIANLKFSKIHHQFEVFRMCILTFGKLPEFHRSKNTCGQDGVAGVMNATVWVVRRRTRSVKISWKKNSENFTFWWQICAGQRRKRAATSQGSRE